MMRAAVLLLGLCAVAPIAVAQQSPFAPRLYINDRVITNYELEQRIQFLRLLRAPGDPETEAMDALIEDRLRSDAAEALDLELTEEQVLAGMTEFAGRANLTAEQFVAALGEAGVDAETFRDFVAAGLVWREVVRARFLPRVSVTDIDIDRALANAQPRAAVRVLLSEIIIPAPAGGEAQALALASRIARDTRGEAAFAAAARQYSAAASAANGGRIDWVPLANLPPAIAPFVLALTPGEVTQPVAIPDAVAVFLLRALEETALSAPAAMEVEYAQYLLPNDGTAEASFARLRGEVDTCNDLYGVTDGAGEPQLTRMTQAMSAVPQDVALELARLDAGEVSTALVRGGNRVFLMLCARRPQLETVPSRDEIRQQILNQRIAGLAEAYLQDLRANAIIREP